MLPMVSHDGMRMMPNLSRMSGIRVIPNNATAASESCSGIRHKFMSRCERSLVARGAGIRDELSGTTVLNGAARRTSRLLHGYHLNHTPGDSSPSLSHQAERTPAATAILLLMPDSPAPSDPSCRVLTPPR